MYLKDILKEMRYNNPCMSELEDINPKQFISEEIKIPVWKMTYSYDTARGNSKQAVKYLFHREDYWDSVENEFNWYIRNFNKKYPYKKVTNVKILDAEYMDEIIISIEN